MPHFFGLHAMQVLPLTGWILTLAALQRRLTLNARRRLVHLAGAGYLLLILLLTWQALRGQPVIAPDALTLGAFALMLALLALLTAVIARQGRQRTTPSQAGIASIPTKASV